jgi:Ca2+-binding EF-hand superfamily protein
VRTLFILFALAALPAWSQDQTPPQSPAREPVATTRSAAAGASSVRNDVQAQDRTAARDLFRQLDRNGDGYLTGDELWSLRGQDNNWAAIDRNRDGRISPDEFTVLRR